MTNSEQIRLRRIVGDLEDFIRDAGEPKPEHLNEFLHARIVKAPGEKVLFSAVHSAFIQTIPPAERPAWSKHRLSRELRQRYTLRTGSMNKLYVMDAAMRETRC